MHWENSMSLSAKIRRAPARLVTGAYIVNSGLEKFRADEDIAKGTHGMAANAYPVFEKVDHKVFVKVLAAGEVTLGAALLLPIVPAAVAGVGLVAFSGGLLGMYWRTPHMHRENDPRPTQEGIAISKDVWMLGIGTALVLDSVTDPVHTKRVQVTQHVKDSAELNVARTAAAADRATGRARGALWGARKTAKAASKSASKSASAAAKSATATAKGAGHTVTTTAKGVADALPVG
jgi:uncharacterized membrane protein YphA (DoxX/SURF4 family)